MCPMSHELRHRVGTERKFTKISFKKLMSIYINMLALLHSKVNCSMNEKDGIKIDDIQNVNKPN